MSRSRTFLGCLILWLSVPAISVANDWPNWRGPHGNGTADAGNYPKEWGPDKNLRWAKELPGKAGSTPIVWNDKIIVTLPIDEQNGVICLNREGKELWRTTLGAARPGKHKKGSGANPSPITDGESIFVYFKSGDLAALDWNGDILWHENLQTNYGEDTLWWDLGTSPVLTDKHVVVACMQTGPSYLAAFDKKTGKEAWKVDRNVPAPEESAQSYTTPVVTTFEGQQQIVVLGADHVTCHAAENGKELWRLSGMNPEQERYWRSIASPVVTDGIVLAPYARGNTLTAIRMGGSGDISKTHVLWSRELGSDVPTPATRDGRAYICGDKGQVTCLDVKTGEEIWSQQLEKNRNAFSASPTLTGNSLYLIREDAKTFVLNAETGEVVATNSLGRDEFCLATPVCVDGEILLRTFEQILCVKQKDASVSQR